MPGTYDSPFAASSLWYARVGIGAVYVPAGFRNDVQFTREDVCPVVLSTLSPLRRLWTYSSHDAWAYTNPPDSRCDEENDTGIDLPIPDSFVVPDQYPDTPNLPGAVLMPDGETIKQFQPLTRCTTAGNVTTFDTAPPDDNIVTGDGRLGAHGGSGMSSLGGVIRRADGWFTKGPTEDLGHALKLEMWAEEFYDPASGPGGGVGYRWPAVQADAGAGASYGSTGTPVSGVQPGALLAIPPANLAALIATLETTVGKILANTLTNFGGRIVDSTSFDAYAVATELSPDGSIAADFLAATGENINVDDSTTTAWARDFMRIIAALNLVSNDSEANVGGGGGIILPGSSGPYDTTQFPTFEVIVNGTRLAPFNPTSVDGIPAVISVKGQVSFDSPVPACTLELTQIPNWPRGLTVIVNAGYSNVNTRMFTGGIFTRGDEDPEYLRTRALMLGATDAAGTQISVEASAIGAPVVWPPRPAGQFIDFSIDNHLIWDEPTAVEEASLALRERARIPAKPTGKFLGRIVAARGDLYGAFASFKIPEADFSGMTTTAAMAQVLTASGVSAFDTSLVPAYTLAASGATVDRSSGIQQLQLLMIKGVKVQQLKSGIVLLKPTDFQPAPTPAFSYSTINGDDCRIISTTGEIRVPFNPDLEIGMTGAMTIPEINVSGNWFLWGHRWELGPQGAWSYLDMRGGPDFGGTIDISPVASFTYVVDQQVIEDDIYDIVTFNFETTHDPDGTITDISVTDNQTPNVIDVDLGATKRVKTVAVKHSDIAAPWLVTETATDNNGLTRALEREIDVAASSTALQIGAIGVAGATNSMLSLDGGKTFVTDLPTGVGEGGVNCIAMRPADGVHFGHAVRSRQHALDVTRDGGATWTEVLPYATGGSNFQYMAWDWRNTLVVWALTVLGKLFVSIDAGATFGLHTDFRATTYNDTTTTPTAVGTWIGLPAGNFGETPVFIGGGTADPGIPLMAFVNNPGETSPLWVRIPFGGELGADLIAGGHGSVHTFGGTFAPEMILGLREISGALEPIYYTTDFTNPALWKRQTGLSSPGDVRILVGDAPIAGQGIFHAMFAGQRRVAHIDASSGAPVITETADVLPSGFSPNHGLFMSDVLTGLTGFSDIYLVAASDDAGTGGIFKAAGNFFTSLASIYPGIAAWPEPSFGMMISVGAPGSSVPGAGTLLRVSGDGADGSVVQRLMTSTWQTIPTGDLTAHAQELQFLQLGGGHLLMFADPVGGFGDVLHSGDGGLTWDVAFTAVGTVFPMSFDVGADGTVWLITLDGANVDPAKIYKSVDHGATFALNYTITMGIAPDPERRSMIAADKTNPNNVIVLSIDATGPVYTIDGGANWIENPTPVDAIPSFSDDYHTDKMFLPGNVVALLVEYNPDGNGAIYTSPDYGDHWTLRQAFTTIHADVFAPYHLTHGNIVFAVAAGAIWRSTNGAISWTQISAVGSPDDFAVTSMEYDRAADILYCLTDPFSGSHIYRLPAASVATDLTTIENISFDANFAGFTGMLALPR